MAENPDISIHKNKDVNNSKIVKHEKVESLLSQKVDRMSAGKPTVTPDSINTPEKDGLVQVVFELEDNDSKLRKTLEQNGVIIETHYKNLVQARVPAAEVYRLADLPFVTFVRTPAVPIPTVISEGVGVINADELHNMGIYGDNVKIAILDLGFYTYESKLGTELPDNVTVRSFSGDIYGGTESHGTACAEIVYDLAPNATMYLVNYATDIEFANAVQYAINEGVDIISSSVGWVNSGGYDGTGMICDIANNASDNGILFVNSAGNQAKMHYEGTFTDTNMNDDHEFSVGDETLTISHDGSNPIAIFLSWDDWPLSDQDFDLYLFDSGLTAVAASLNSQTGTQQPTEVIYDYFPAGVYHIVITKYSATRNVHLELYSFTHNFPEYNVPNSSLLSPADATGVLTAGATYWSNDNLESFSSRGPTNDGRFKPDVVTPDGVSSSVYGVFYGTSASAPHAAGATALLLSNNPSLTPDKLKATLENTSLDLGGPGKDNLYGSGRIDVLAAVSAQPPQVSNVSIYPNPTNSNPVLNATISDALNNISYADLYIDSDTGNVTILNPIDGAFDSRSENVTATINITGLPDGIHNVTIRANDSLDYWNNNTNVSFTVDTRPPSIILNSPANNTSIRSGIPINLSIVDATTNISNVTYNYNGTNLTLTDPYNINTTTWPEGLTNITVRAADAAGNINNTTFVFSIDNTPPNITSVQHNGTGILDVGDVLWVNLTGDPGQNATFRVTGTGINQTLTQISAGHYSANYTIGQGIEVNNSTLTGYLTDAAGNTNSTDASTRISIDTMAPRITLTSPTNISYIRSGTILNFTISDAFLQNVTYSLNSTQANYTSTTNATLSPPFDINTSLWNESQFNLTIRANDSLNHINSTTYQITVDNSLNLTITSPTSNHTTTDSSTTISGTTDKDANLTINSESIAHINGSFSETRDLAMGPNSFVINATDRAGNFLSRYFTITRVSPVSSSSGGGGGGGFSGEDFNNIAQTQTRRETVFKGERVSYEFENTLNPIIYINFSARISAGKVTTKIEVLQNTSTLVDMPPPGIVYKNINIWVGNYGWANERSIADARIHFLVSKEWLEDHNITPGNIKLYRYHQGSWNSLPTSLMGEDDEYVHYESSTPGFSPFAISGEPVKPATPVRTQTPGTAPEAKVSIIEGPEAVESGKGRGMAWVLVIIAGLVLAAVAFFRREHIRAGITNMRQRLGR